MRQNCTEGSSPSQSPGTDRQADSPTQTEPLPEQEDKGPSSSYVSVVQVGSGDTMISIPGEHPQQGEELPADGGLENSSSLTNSGVNNMTTSTQDNNNSAG